MVTTKPLFLIPIKAFSKTKSRLRAALPPQYSQIIENLVKISFFNLINTIKTLSYHFAVVSSSQTIIDNCKQIGAIFTFKDAGVDLNQALSSASQLLPSNQPIIIIMPDLPFISNEFLVSLLNKISKDDNDVVIVPSISDDNTKGTAILYLKKPNLLTFRFGENSSLKFQSNADQNGLSCRLISFEPFARDIDTLDDIKYLKQNLEMLCEPEQFIVLLGKIS